MIYRTFDKGFPNAVINHPDVRGWVRGPCSGLMDLSSVMADHKNIVLAGEHGFAIFVHRIPGIYEMHAAVQPDGRGKWALSAASAALLWMFNGDAWGIIAPVPEHNAAARHIVRALGFNLVQVVPGVWPSEDGRLVSLRVYTLLRKEWVLCQ